MVSGVNFSEFDLQPCDWFYLFGYLLFFILIPNTIYIRDCKKFVKSMTLAT